jgi:putative solute:sodium symporter small subunit
MVESGPLRLRCAPVSDQPHTAAERAAIDAHWRRNLRLMAGLLAVWAFVSLGCGVLLADWLNQWSLGGFPLGFWFAQQGSIVVFVVLILVYALAMRRLDRRHHEELTALGAADPAPR